MITNDKNYVVRIETITPEKAKALISNFPRNRKSSNVRVQSYTEIMKKGNWAPFSTIIIDEDGNTVDGHHRLEAVIKSCIPIDMVVFRGLEKKYIPFIDTGRPRSAGDMLAFIEKLDGVSSLKNIAALSRAILYYKNKSQTVIVQQDDLANFIINNLESIKKAYSDYSKLKKIGGNLSHGAAIWVIRDLNKNFQTDIDSFVDKIAIGENICVGMPTYAARNSIITSHKGSWGSSVWRFSFYTILRAWNAEINCENISHMKMNSATLENIINMKIVKG